MTAEAWSVLERGDGKIDPPKINNKKLAALNNVFSDMVKIASH